MLKALLIIVAIVLASSIPFLSNASFAASQTPNFSIKDSGNYRLSDFVNITSNDLASITGKKMNIFNRISFFKMRSDMKKAVKKEPNISVSEYYSSRSKRMGTGLKFIIFFFAAVLLVFLVIAIIWSTADFH